MLGLLFLRGWNFSGQSAEFLPGALDLALQLGALEAIHLHGGTRQAPVGPEGDGHDHFQIAQHGRDRGAWWSGLALPLRFQKQQRLFHNPLADRRGSVTPGGIQLLSLPAGEAMLGQGGGHALAVLGAGSRHRNQALHRHVSRDRARPHLLLDAFRKEFHQSQAARDPTRAAVKAPR